MISSAGALWRIIGQQHQGPVIIGQGLGVTPQAVEQAAARHVGRDASRVESNCLRQVGLRQLELTVHLVGACPVDVSGDAVRPQRQVSAKIGDGKLGLAGSQVSQAAVVIGTHRACIAADGAGKILDRRGVLAEVIIGQPAIGIGLGAQRRQPQGLA